ncbi:hypothetical protein ABPG72_009331 [Tetrahymena utriculariae]
MQSKMCNTSYPSNISQNKSQSKQLQNQECYKKKYQLLGGSENYSKDFKCSQNQEQQLSDEQDFDSQQLTKKKKRQKKQLIQPLINEKIEQIKIVSDFNQTELDKNFSSSKKYGEQENLGNELNQLIQVLCDKYQEMIASDQSLIIEKKKSEGEQKVGQLQNATSYSYKKIDSKQQDYESDCLFNQNSLPQFEQKGVERYQSDEKSLSSLQQNQKSTQQHEKEKILRDITTLNVELQNKYFSYYSLDNGAALNLTLQRVRTSQLSIPCFTFFTNNLSNIKTFTLKFKYENNQAYHIQTEIISAVLYIDLFINVLSLQNITNLTLDFSQLPMSGGYSLAQATARFLEKCQNITELNLNFFGNQIGNEVAQCIANIMQTCQNLANLSIGLNFNLISADAAQVMESVLQKFKSNIHLKQYGNNNKIDVEGTEYITSILNQCKQVNQLSIELGRNSINNVGVQNIAKGLEKCQNTDFLFFDLKQFQLKLLCTSSINSIFLNIQKLFQNNFSRFLILQKKFLMLNKTLIGIIISTMKELIFQQKLCKDVIKQLIYKLIYKKTKLTINDLIILQALCLSVKVLLSSILTQI